MMIAPNSRARKGGEVKGEFEGRRKVGLRGNGATQSAFI